MTYTDGTVYIVHADGTKIMTKGNQIFVEKEEYAHVQVSLEKEGEEDVITSALRKKSVDGKVIRLFMQDMSHSVSCLRKDPFSGETIATHLIEREDMTVLKIDSNGEVGLVSSNTRAHINMAG